MAQACRVGRVACHVKIGLLTSSITWACHARIMGKSPISNPIDKLNPKHNRRLPCCKAMLVLGNSVSIKLVLEDINLLIVLLVSFTSVIRNISHSNQLYFVKDCT